MSKRNKALFFLPFFILTLITSSCKDFIEKNIENDTPVIILPLVDDTISANPVHFKWQELDGATKYRIEIVSPSFAAIQNFVVDSIITGTNFYIDLDSNEFQFRLTALNAGYSSLTTPPQTFWVGTSQGSTGTTVQLNSPANNLYVNETFSGNYSWFSLSNVSSYTFELHEGTTFAGATLHFSDQIATSSISSFDGTELNEGAYCWGVKAYLNDGTETNYAKRVFYVDTTDPGLAGLVSPINSTTLNAGLITFNWSFPSDNGIVQSPLIGTLEVSTNTSFTNLLTPESVTGTSASKNLSAGVYYWRVKVSDSAGNIGEYPSNYWTLNIVP